MQTVGSPVVLCKHVAETSTLMVIPGGCFVGVGRRDSKTQKMLGESGREALREQTSLETHLQQRRRWQREKRAHTEEGKMDKDVKSRHETLANRRQQNVLIKSAVGLRQLEGLVGRRSNLQ